MSLISRSSDEIRAVHDEARDRYGELRAAGLKLDLTRGKPSAEQLGLAEQLLGLPTGHDDEDGTDCRNYGGIRGALAIRRIYADLLGIPVENVIAGNNASLEMMYDNLAFAMLHGAPGSERPWAREEKLRFLCPVPGYDRHFAITEHLGFEMIPVRMREDGPDMDAVAALVAEDPTIKGIWCVPTYSNPTGAVYSEEVTRRLMSMPTAAPDFRVMWDNAYVVHILGDTFPQVYDVLGIAAEAGNPDRPLIFTSTSKITFAGSGVAIHAASAANLDWFTHHLGIATIGPNKVNHLAHAEFFADADGVRAHMVRHRDSLAPKFARVLEILDNRLGEYEIADWTRPEGGYFISMDVLPGTATRVVELAREAGVALTAAGAAFPLGVDPADENIRLAPSLPPLAEVEAAMDGVATCVLLAATEKLLADA